ncbi:MAG: ATP-binding cassette domain-containing protein [Actinobacteria bacterium]|nr:ATP-binding cassette domain-containing protein [Actinomycetota bacterium]
MENGSAPIESAGAVVVADDVTRRYGAGDTAVDALRGVSLEVGQGKLTAVMGPSGSGKSTLMHILAGLDKPTSGTVSVSGIEITTLKDSDLTKLRRRHIGFVFQFFNLLPMLTADENIKLPLAIAGAKPDPAFFRELIEKVGLADRLTHRPSELSGGQLFHRSEHLVRLRARQVADDLAVGEEEDPVCDRGRAGLVRDHDRRLAVLVDGVAHQREDLAAGGRVEVARRLVGEEHRRTRDERARDGDALLLAARELGWAMAPAIGEPGRVEQLLEPLALDPGTGDREREGDVLLGGEHRQEVEELEDETDVPPAKPGQLVVLQGRDLHAVDLDRAARRPVEPGENVHESRLARAGRAHDGGQVTAGDLQRDTAERRYGRLARAVRAL